MQQAKKKAECAGTHSAPRTIRDATSYEKAGKHPVPILTHYPRRRKRVRLIWTPLNAALLILLIAAMIFFVIRAMTEDPMAQSDLMVSMANSVYRI